MQKILVAAAFTLAICVPAMAEEVTDVQGFPKTVAEWEFCAKAYTSGGEIPDGCKTLGMRILEGVSKAASSS